MFLLGCNLKIFIKRVGGGGIDFWWERNKNLVEGGGSNGENFSRWGVGGGG